MSGFWACVFCGNPVEEHGFRSLCCGEVNHTEYVEDEAESDNGETTGSAS